MFGQIRLVYAMLNVVGSG